MNLLDLTPALKRHIRQYIKSGDTDSKLAAYLADGIEALAYRWSRSYVVTHTAPETYVVEPDIAAKDKRAVVLAAAIIYKMGNIQLASYRDQDFAYDPQQGRQNPIQVDVEELARFLPIYRLAKATTSSLRGFNGVANPESYAFLFYMV